MATMKSYRKIRGGGEGGLGMTESRASHAKWLNTRSRPKNLIVSRTFNSWLNVLVIHKYIQGVPGVMCQTSGGCSLC